MPSATIDAVQTGLMDPAVPSVVSSLLVVGVLATLYSVHHEKFLRSWALAWFGWTISYIVPSVTHEFTPLAWWYLPIVYLRESLVILGLQQFTGRPLARWWFVLVALDVALIAAGAVSVEAPIAGRIFHFAVVALPSLVTAWHLAKNQGWEGQVAGLGFLGNGLLILTVPLVIAVPSMAGGFWALSEAADLVIAFGVALAYYQRRHAARTALVAREASAMQFVIGGFVPICSYCHALRNRDGEWQSIEAVVAAGVSAEVATARCPSCAP